MYRNEREINLIKKINNYNLNIEQNEESKKELTELVCQYFDEIKNENLEQSDLQFLRYIANIVGIPQYFEILKVLNDNGYEAYIVGGFVRDKLLGINTSDIDICTSATPKEVLNIFKNNVKVIEEYGAVKLTLDDNTVDITTFRTEENYINNKPTKVNYTKSLKDDLLRRDFTINTICLDKELNIIDPLNAINDIRHKLLKVVGNTEQKLEEDATRMLRSLRFMAVYNFTLDKQLYDYILSNKEKFATISYTKRKEELDKLFKNDKIKVFLDFIKEHDIERFLGIKSNNFVETGTIIGVWAQLEVNEGYQFTKNEREEIKKIKEIIYDKNISKETIYHYGLYLSMIAGDILGVDKAIINEIYKNLPIKSAKDMNITYLDIQEITNARPKIINNILKNLETEILNGKIENNREKLIEKIKEYL